MVQRFQAFEGKIQFPPVRQFRRVQLCTDLFGCELAAAKPVLVGQLSTEDLKALRNALIEAETMETRDLNRVCKALVAAI